jgi:WD40 repeat protein
LSANIQAKTSDTNLIAIVKDSERFVLRFFDAIELSASHIYESALPLSPSSSLVRARYLNQVSTDVNFSIIDDAWDACTRTIQSEYGPYFAAFSHKDDLVAIGEEDIAVIFEAATGQRRATLMTNYVVTSLSFSPDDNILASGEGGEDAKVDMWDLQTGGHIGTLKGHNSLVRSIEFSPCGNMITTCDDCTIRIWDTFSLDCRFFMEGHSKQVWDVCWSGSGSKVISGSLDETVKVWSVSDKECSQTLTISTGGPVNSVASSPDSTLIVTGSDNGTVKVFDAETGDFLHTISMNIWGPYLIRFLNREQIMCLTQDGGKFTIWDVTNSVEVLTFKCEGRGCAISSDGTRIVSRQHDIVNIWQADTPIQNTHHRTKPMRKMLKKIKSAFTFPLCKSRATTSQESQATLRHTGDVICVTFSKDEQLVASGSADRTVKIWNTSTSTGQCLTTFRGHRGIVFRVVLSPDSKLCASWGFGDAIRIWNVHTGTQVSTIKHWGLVYGMYFSSDGAQLVSFSSDGAQLVSSYSDVKLWDVLTGDCLASMNVEREKFTNISFGIDGTSIILRDRSDEIQRWTISSAHNPNQKTPRLLLFHSCPWFLSPSKIRNHLYFQTYLHIYITATSRTHGSWTTRTNTCFGYHLIQKAFFMEKKSSLDLILER